MNKDQVKGTAKKVAGKAQEQAGKLVGSTKLEVKGLHQQADGHIQKTVGDAKEVLKDLRRN
jgi:uncharacterized protein YjbJ (UPF0337 family)